MTPTMLLVSLASLSVIVVSKLPLLPASRRSLKAAWLVAGAANTATAATRAAVKNFSRNMDHPPEKHGTRKTRRAKLPERHVPERACRLDRNVQSLLGREGDVRHL